MNDAASVVRVKQEETEDDHVRRLFGHLSQIVRTFGLVSLDSGTRACDALTGGQVLLDVAVLGQFKSGKSTLLNTLVGTDLLPVGAIPVTAVITRLTAGAEMAAKVTTLDGRTNLIDVTRIAEFVTESLNPENERRVATVDVVTPNLREWPNLRLVDTPGLGSTFGHNTKATKEWMPNVAAALVVVSADRPLSEEDRQLIGVVRRLAPRVWVVLSKIDLLDADQLSEVIGFLQERLRASFGVEIPVIPFSSRQDRIQNVQRLRDEVLRPLVENPRREKQAVFRHKVEGLRKSCIEYLEVALRSASQAETDRERLRGAILDESVSESVIRDEISLNCQRACELIRPAFERCFQDRLGPIQYKLVDKLRNDLPTWRGHLGHQSRHFEDWLRTHLTTELDALATSSEMIAKALIIDAENRFRRVVEAFRDRLARNLARSLNLTLSPVAWEARIPDVVKPDTNVSKTFDTNWELLSWVIPMPLFGWLFRWHCLGRVPWEVEKNLRRLVSDWYETVAAAMQTLREQALAWVRAELATLRQLLDRQINDVPMIEDNLRRLQSGLSD